MVDRRTFLISLLLGVASCGSSGGNSSSLQPQPQLPQGRSILFGLGEDPERLVNGYDPEGKRVLDILEPNILNFWLNGSVDDRKQPYGNSMHFIRDWANKGRFKEWSELGYSLMLITWENYDGQNPSFGGPTYGEYHISQTFLQDLRDVLSILKSQVKGKVYIALATEQSTYTACRYNQTCKHEIPYTDSINDLTKDYYTRLRSNLLNAIDIIKNSGVDAVYGICFGGWLVEFQEGINFIRFFEPVIQNSNAIFFQSMFDYKMSENGGYGNPQRILKNCEFFSQYGKPLHLAHYMPNNKRADVVADDMTYMNNSDYIGRLYRLGLRSFSFMSYGLVKNNEYGSLDKLSAFRKSLKEVSL
ncbi:hypothetical protein [Pampinifervens florentissimum]|uniref:hypothetical protein n=1 Tax=Pampinifervens florentissimum TaxID=1632019 RepID=UPI0013B48FA7|nr:hypothetical protein [Hydrogenobacter sp. T-8]QID33856.1 hypothetical protein G3M65_08765 [Hydrogenobacter sp. T-8]